MLFSGVALPKVEYDFKPEYPIDQLIIPYDSNGEGYDSEKGLRKYDSEANEALDESMRKFGFLEPIIAAPDGTVIHGIHRLLAAGALQQATIPVIIIKNWKHPRNETRFYNLIVNKMNDWSTWLAPNVDDVLRSVDGGVKSRIVQGDDGTFIVVPDEVGEYRNLAKKLGLFIDVIPRQLSASAVDLLVLAKMRIKSLGRRYQYNDEQILYIETLRNQIDQYRRKAVEEGVDTSGNLKEKLDQVSKWDDNNMENGIKVARIVFLHSIGVPKKSIAKIVGVPVNNDKARAAAKKAGIDTFMEAVTVENAILRSSRRNFDPLKSYGYWIDHTLRTRYRVMDQEAIIESMRELEQYRKDSGFVVSKDEIAPPEKALDLSSKDAVKKFNLTVSLIMKNISSDSGITREVVEDWVKWPEKLKFYSNECFKDVLEVDRKLHPIKLEKKTPMDVKTTRQTTDKECAKGEWIEIRWLDAVCDGKLNDLPEITPDYSILSDDDELSDEDALKIVNDDANRRRLEAIAAMRKDYDAESGKIYDRASPDEFNNMLVKIRTKYRVGPINMWTMGGPKHDGDVSSDPDAKIDGSKNNAKGDED
jgi:signal recognition particle subunit SEC65